MSRASIAPSPTWWRTCLSSPSGWHAPPLSASMLSSSRRALAPESTRRRWLWSPCSGTIRQFAPLQTPTVDSCKATLQRHKKANIYEKWVKKWRHCSKAKHYIMSIRLSKIAQQWNDETGLSTSLCVCLCAGWHKCKARRKHEASLKEPVPRLRVRLKCSSHSGCCRRRRRWFASRRQTLHWHVMFPTWQSFERILRNLLVRVSAHTNRRCNFDSARLGKNKHVFYFQQEKQKES